jgi:hypothetical protein
MRGLKTYPRRGLLVVVFLGAVLAVVPSVGAAKAQQNPLQQTPGSKVPSMPSIDGHDPSEPPDPMLAKQQADRARAALDERQRKIVDDTAKLLQLATELKQDVDKSNKNQMSLEVIRKADDIERLAHDVKTRMRGM